MRATYEINPVPIVIRSQMEGKTRVRKRFSKQPYITTISFRLSDAQLPVFEYFWQNELSSGVEWVQMPLVSGRGLQYVKARFMTEPKTSADGRYWKVSVQVEIDELPIYSEDEYVQAISGMADVPDIHQIVHEQMPEDIGDV